MSIETTLARGEVRHRQRQLREHRAGCPRCHRRPADPCRSGLAIGAALALAKGNLKREIEADLAPIDGQITLIEM